MNALVESTNEGQRPRFHVWFLLLERLADASQLDPSLEIDINQTIRRILDVYPEAWPGSMMQIGLRTAEITKDADLMARLIDRDLVRRRQALTRSASKVTDNSDDTRSGRTSSVPEIVFRKALQIAMQNNDFESMSSIFASFREVSHEYPSNARSECYGLMVRGYARSCRMEKSKELLLSMVEEGLATSDGLFGDVLQSFLDGGKPEDAHDLFLEMQDPQTNLPIPGTSSYNTIIVSHIQRRAWDEAISTFNRMREAGIRPSAQNIQGYLLAQFGRNGSSCIPIVIEDLLKDQMPMDEAIFLFISRILLPVLGGKSTADIRLKARQLGETEPHLQELCLKIVRSARSAEVNEKKSKTISENSKREGGTLRTSSSSWSEAVQSVLTLSRGIETASKSEVGAGNAGTSRVI
jgi:pentatricopeptide repeat protein